MSAKIEDWSPAEVSKLLIDNGFNKQTAAEFECNFFKYIIQFILHILIVLLILQIVTDIQIVKHATICL